MTTAADDFVLVLFIGLACASLWATWWFFARKKLHRQRSVFRVIVGNLLMLSVIICVFLSGGEIYYRFVYDSTESFGLSRVTQRWFARHFQRNNVNFRDSVDHPLRRIPGLRRWTVVGDSFTAAQGVPNVEDRFVERLREEFPDVEIHSQAMCGWDTPQEIDAIRAALDAGYEYDVVILAYCLNDIADVSAEWQQVLTRVQKLRSDHFFVKHSFFINTMYYRWRALCDPDIASYYEFVPELYAGETWTQQQQQLRALHDVVSNSGGELVVVTFPFLHALGRSDDAAIHARLNAFWQSLDVVHLDLRPNLLEHAAADLVVNAYDAHPNERAHEIAAAAISDFLKGRPELRETASE